MKHIHNLRPLALAFILVVTGIAAAVCGLLMKGQLQKYVGGYDDKWAVAVPFLMLRDDTDWQRMLLAAKMRLRRTPAGTPEPAPEPEPEPAPEPEPEFQPRWWSPMPCTARTRAFFDNALFIGDSRMVNVANYARLGNADYFDDVGMTVFKRFSTTASDKTSAPRIWRRCCVPGSTAIFSSCWASTRPGILWEPVRRPSGGPGPPAPAQRHHLHSEGLRCHRRHCRRESQLCSKEPPDGG